MPRRNTVKKVVANRTLTKYDIVDDIYTDIKITRKRAQIEEDVEKLIELIKRAIVNEGELLISGFGKFEAYLKGERKGRNPHTGEIMILPARRVVAFRLSRKIRTELDKRMAAEKNN